MAINGMCRPTRNIGYIFNGIVSGEVANIVTHLVFSKPVVEDSEEEVKINPEPEVDEGFVDELSPDDLKEVLDGE